MDPGLVPPQLQGWHEILRRITHYLSGLLLLATTQQRLPSRQQLLRRWFFCRPAVETAATAWTVWLLSRCSVSCALRMNRLSSDLHVTSKPWQTRLGTWLVMIHAAGDWAERVHSSAAAVNNFPFNRSILQPVTWSYTVYMYWVASLTNLYVYHLTVKSFMLSVFAYRRRHYINRLTQFVIICTQMWVITWMTTMLTIILFLLLSSSTDLCCCK